MPDPHMLLTARATRIVRLHPDKQLSYCSIGNPILQVPFIKFLSFSPFEQIHRYFWCVQTYLIRSLPLHPNAFH